MYRRWRQRNLFIHLPSHIARHFQFGERNLLQSWDRSGARNRRGHLKQASIHSAFIGSRLDPQWKSLVWIRVTAPIITTGGLRLTPFVADLVQGEWDVQLPDGTVYGHGPLLAKAVTVPHTGAAALLVFPMRAGLAIWGAFSISMAAFITRVVVQVNPWLPPSAEAGVQGGT